MLLPPRRVPCGACERPVTTPLLPLALLDVLLLVPLLWLTFDQPLGDYLQLVQEQAADRHGHYVFLSGLFFTAVAFAWSWVLCIPLTKPPEPLYVPRFRHLPPRLRRRR